MSKLSTKVRREIVRGLNDFNMIEEGDRIMVACSGGKDSTILLLLLEEIRKKSPITFSLFPVMLDQKQPGFNAIAYTAWLKEQGVELDIISEDTYSIVQEKTPEGKAFCGVCSRLRRGILYNYAEAQDFTKIALGHHRDDMNQTLLMNLFFAGKIAGMPAKLRSDDHRNILIRPMVYVAEEHIIELAKDYAFPIMPCNLCGTQENLQRQEMKNLLFKMEAKHPDIGAVMQNAMSNIRPSQLADQDLWSFDDFEHLQKVVSH